MEKSCGIILISNVDKKILLVRHKEWHRWFPKWHQENNENEIEAALRELKEETWIIPNYLVSNIQFSEEYLTNRGLKKVIYFIWYVNRKEVKLEYNELDDFKRNSFNQIKDNKKFLSVSILGELEKILKKEVILKYNKTKKYQLLLPYKIQWSKHAYSRVVALRYLTWNIKLTNIPNILDVWILDEIHAISNLSWETITIPKELSDRSRSIIPLLPGLLYKHNEIILNFPKWCSIGARKIDLYLDILEKFWNKVIYDGNNIVLKKWNNYVWNYDFYFPSFSWTSIAITLASSIESKTTLNNISIEPEILFQIETLKKCGVTINFLAERSIEIQWIDFSKMKNQLLIKIPEDRNVLITKLILAIITNTEFYYKSDYDLHLSSLLLELEKMWINYVYDKYSIKINRIHKQLKPINILANFYPGICSDWQPFIALVLILISWRSIIKDSVFENRYKYIKEISKIIPKFSYDILWNSLEIIWLVKNKKCDLKNEIMCLDLRSGAVNTIWCFLSPIDEIKIKNIYQINRWYENIVWDISDVLWINNFSYEYE